MKMNLVLVLIFVILGSNSVTISQCTTNNLIKTAKLAEAKDAEYKTIFTEIENHHIDVVKALIPANVQSGVIGNVKRLTNQLETLFDGCFMLEELTDKALATISGFGERLSSYIISEAAKLSLDAQQEAFKNAQQRYTFEAITSFEFDQDRNRFVNAESALIRAKYDYVFKSKVLKFYYGESVLD